MILPFYSCLSYCIKIILSIPKSLRCVGFHTPENLAGCPSLTALLLCFTYLLSISHHSHRSHWSILWCFLSMWQFVHLVKWWNKIIFKLTINKKWNAIYSNRTYTAHIFKVYTMDLDQSRIAPWNYRSSTYIFNSIIYLLSAYCEPGTKTVQFLKFSWCLQTDGKVKNKDKGQVNIPLQF